MSYWAKSAVLSAAIALLIVAFGIGFYGQHLSESGSTAVSLLSTRR